MNEEPNFSDQACTLNSCLFFSTAKLARAFGKIADEAFCTIGLSPSHALILYLVNRNNGIQQKQIGETLHLTPSTVTRLIEKLERKNLVSKLLEGKHVYLNTTPEGMALQEEIIKSWNQLHNSYMDILTQKETADFISISGKLLEKLDNQ